MLYVSYLYFFVLFFFFFFFQAEDGIRDVAVTGVQTCALPISQRAPKAVSRSPEQTVEFQVRQPHLKRDVQPRLIPQTRRPLPPALRSPDAIHPGPTARHPGGGPSSAARAARSSSPDKSPHALSGSGTYPVSRSDRAIALEREVPRRR